MRLFIYEFICGSACSGPWSSVLRVEGRAMLSALLVDFIRVPGVQVCTLLDEKCPAPPVDVLVRRVRPGEEETAFRKAAAEADFALVIAPEFDDLLLERSQWAQAAGSRLLGPEPAAIRLTGDKRALGAHLQARGVATPPVFSCSAAVPPELTWPAICKPRHVAGATAT